MKWAMNMNKEKKTLEVRIKRSEKIMCCEISNNSDYLPENVNKTFCLLRSFTQFTMMAWTKEEINKCFLIGLIAFNYLKRNKPKTFKHIFLFLVNKLYLLEKSTLFWLLMFMSMLSIKMNIIKSKLYFSRFLKI